MSDQDTYCELASVLGYALVEFIAGDGDIPEWMRDGSAPIPEHASRRLRVALDVVEALSYEDGADTIRAWFIGMNPFLGDNTPSECIRYGFFDDVRSAAKSFVATG